MPPHSPKSMEDLTRELRKKREQLEQGGGPDRLAKQKEQGKLTARERIAALVDANSFEEFGLFAQHRQVSFGMADKEIPADGVVTGAASVDGRLIHLASQDFTVLGGSAGEVHSLKVADVMHRSLKTGSPFVFINDSGGARVQEGIDSLSGYGQVFYANVLLSGAVPQISLICGPCAGGAAYSPALTDFIIQTRQAQMFITGPQVMKQVTGEDISAEELGGADAHMAHSGVIHFVAEDDNDAIYLCRRLLSFLPSNNLEEPPTIADRSQRRSQSGIGRRRAGRSQTKLRRSHRHHRHRRSGRFPGSASRLCHEYGGRFRPHCRPLDRHHRQPAGGAGRRDRHQRRRPRPPASSASATPSISRSSRLSTCPATCPACSRNTAASFATAQSCCLPIPRRRFRKFR